MIDDIVPKSKDVRVAGRNPACHGQHPAHFLQTVAFLLPECTTSSTLPPDSGFPVAGVEYYKLETIDWIIPTVDRVQLLMMKHRINSYSSQYKYRINSYSSQYKMECCSTGTLHCS